MASGSLSISIHRLPGEEGEGNEREGQVISVSILLLLLLLQLLNNASLLLAVLVVALLVAVFLAWSTLPLVRFFLPFELQFFLLSLFLLLAVAVVFLALSMTWSRWKLARTQRDRGARKLEVNAGDNLNMQHEM